MGCLFLLLISESCNFPQWICMALQWGRRVVAYLIPDCGLKTVRHPFPRHFKGPDWSGSMWRACQSLPAGLCAWENKAFRGGGHLGLISPPSCAPFSLHLNIPGEGPGCSPHPPLLSPASLHLRLCSLRTRHPALTAPYKSLPGDGFSSGGL